MASPTRILYAPAVPHLTRHDGRVFFLRPRVLIGRRDVADLALDDTRVSSEHASLRWTSRGWMVQDLGSRNGTRVGGKALEVGQRLLLQTGDELAFGSMEERWTLADAGEPAALARSEHGTELQADGGLLALPDDDAPQAIVLPGGPTGWVLDRPDGREAVEDGEQVTLDGMTWTLVLPTELEPTQEATPTQRGIAHVRLMFKVSLDEEEVIVTGEHCHEALDLGSRAHHYLLLLLARQRIADAAADPPLPESEHGWVYNDDLGRMLRISEQTVYLHVHRARRQLADAGIPDAAAIIERRPRAQQLRIGVAQLEEQTAD